MRRGLSTPAVTAAFLSTLLLLGIVGYTAGYVAAGSELENQGLTDPTTSTQASKPPVSSPSPQRPTANPTPAATGSPTETPSRPDQFEMPNLVGKDFRVARLEAQALRLGVNVNFDAPSNKSPGTVITTKPEARTFVWPGLTIQLYVSGGPPNVLVPQVEGASCEEAGDRVLNAGLRIKEYPSGRKGNVTKLEPDQGSSVKWNDFVTIFCV